MQLAVGSFRELSYARTSTQKFASFIKVRLYCTWHLLLPLKGFNIFTNNVLRIYVHVFKLFGVKVLLCSANEGSHPRVCLVFG